MESFVKAFTTCREQWDLAGRTPPSREVRRVQHPL